MKKVSKPNVPEDYVTKKFPVPLPVRFYPPGCIPNHEPVSDEEHQTCVDLSETLEKEFGKARIRKLADVLAESKVADLALQQGIPKAVEIVRELVKDGDVK